MALCDFLESGQVRDLIHFADSNASRFRPLSALESDGAGQRGLILEVFSPLQEFFRDRLSGLIPEVSRKLGINGKVAGEVVVWLLAFGDGDYKLRFCDSTTDQADARKVSFIYQFFSDPPLFQGGNVRLFASHGHSDHGWSSIHGINVGSVNNSLIFSPAETVRAITPVKTSSDLFVNKKFFVTGWINLTNIEN